MPTAVLPSAHARPADRDARADRALVLPLSRAEAERHLRVSIELADARLSVDPLDPARHQRTDATENLGNALMSLGRFDEAEVPCAHPALPSSHPARLP